MQAALMIRSKKRVARRKRLKKEGRLIDLPSNVSVKQLGPFPRYPPDHWVGDLDTSVKCAQGRAAWVERGGRRCSVQENSTSCHRRWVKRNRIHDSSLGSSGDDDFLGVLRGPSSFANAFLYVGLGTVAIGLVIAFVGTGEKGFKTVELRLIGPSLIAIGLVCCVLRILFCICPSHCLSSGRRKMNEKNAKVGVDHTTSLLQAENKRVSISKACLNETSKEPNNKHTTTEGIDALRRIASTSLYLHNEQNQSSSNVPTIKEPDKAKEDGTFEMRHITAETRIQIDDDAACLIRTAVDSTPAMQTHRTSHSRSHSNKHHAPHRTTQVHRHASGDQLIGGRLTSLTSMPCEPDVMSVTFASPAESSQPHSHHQPHQHHHHHHHPSLQQQQQQQHHRQHHQLSPPIRSPDSDGRDNRPATGSTSSAPTVNAATATATATAAVATSKLQRGRAPLHRIKLPGAITADSLLMETSLILLDDIVVAPILPDVHLPIIAPKSDSQPPPPSSLMSAFGAAAAATSSPPPSATLTTSSTSTSNNPPTIVDPYSTMARHYQQIQEHQLLVQQLASQHSASTAALPTTTAAAVAAAATAAAGPQPPTSAPSTTFGLPSQTPSTPTAFCHKAAHLHHAFHQAESGAVASVHRPQQQYGQQLTHHQQEQHQHQHYHPQQPRHNYQQQQQPPSHQQQHPQRSMSSGSAAATKTEPELVLSPSKLGQ